MIAVFAPYGRNEVTGAALRLADLFIEAGLDVKLVAVGVRETNVHPRWDSLVVSGASGGVHRAAKLATTCVWFTVDALALNSAREASKAFHVLVPSLHALRPGDAAVVRSFDSIVCPTRLGKDLIKTYVFGQEKPGDRLTWAVWDAGLPCTARDGLVDESVRRVAFWCDSASIDECPLVVLATVDRILQRFADVAITVMCAKTWSRRDRARTKALALEYGHVRLSFMFPRGFVEQAEMFQMHDWLVLPGVRSDFGLTAARGLACGLPVVCYDASPFAEQVIEGRSGAVVPCETVGGWMQAPVAVATLAALSERLGDVLEDRQTLYELQSNDWKLEHGSQAFKKFWLSVFGL